MNKQLTNYYNSIIKLAFTALKSRKRFKFDRYLNNKTINKMIDDELLSIYGDKPMSEETRKLFTDYQRARKRMSSHANLSYRKAVNFLNSTEDEFLQTQYLKKLKFTGHIDKRGANWSIEGYSKMYWNHMERQMKRQSVLDSAVGEANARFQVSSHNSTCKLCGPYDGKIITRDIPKGLFHPNCKHTIALITHVNKIK